MIEEEQWEVEYIEDARVKPNEGWEYLVKWKNYTTAFNTWEGEAQFDQQDPIREFWKTHSREEVMAPSHSKDLPKQSLELSSEGIEEITSKIYPKITEKDIESILGISKNNGQKICKVKVHNYPKPIHIPAMKMREICPSKLIKYYESKIVKLV